MVQEISCHNGINSIHSTGLNLTQQTMLSVACMLCMYILYKECMCPAQGFMLCDYLCELLHNNPSVQNSHVTMYSDAGKTCKISYISYRYQVKKLAVLYTFPSFFLTFPYISHVSLHFSQWKDGRCEILHIASVSFLNHTNGVGL